MSKFRKLVVEFLKVNPLETGETYYDYDSGYQDGSNNIMNYLIDFLKETEDE